MIKKIIAIITVLAIALSGVSVFAQGLNDIAQSRQKTAIEALYGMGLVYGDENGNFNPEKEITRIEFLAMVLRMVGLEDAAKATEGAELPFTDVPKGHWGCGYAYLAYNMGIINGVSETKFGTNNMVTYNQAAKMIVAALGYTIVAERSGGWPSGYLAQAIKLDLLDGIKAGERALLREEVARIILNSLTVPILEELNGEYTPGDDSLTILGCKKYQGTVTSTYDTQTGIELTPDMVEISGKLYDTTYFVSGELLGASVVFYTKIVNGEEVVCLVYERYTTDKLEVSAENILSGTTLSEFIYEENGKTRHESLPGASLKVVYNGKTVGTSHMKDSILKPASGSVVLRDSDGNGIYDIAIVTEYITLVANAVSSSKIYDKYGNNVDIDIDEEQITVYSDGRSAQLTDICDGDILTVSRSIDKKKLVIYINRESFTGKVTERYDDEEELTYGIETDDGTEKYTLAKEYTAALSARKSAAAKFDLGDSGIFYTNHVGEIAFCVLTDSTEDTEYGYLLEAASPSGLGTSAQFRMLTLNNKFTVFDTPKGQQIYFGRIVGNSYERSRVDADEVIKYLTDSAEFPQQICSYRLDEEGMLVEIQLADTRGSNTQYLSRPFSPRSMNYTQNLLNQTYIVDEDTAVFYIPNSGQYEDIMAAGKYNKFLATGRVNVAVYDLKDSHVGALVYLPLSIERYDNGLGEYETIIDSVNSPVMYIQKSSYVQGEDGEYYLTLTGIEDGEIVSVKVANELSGISEDKSLLKPGVAIQYEKNDLTRGRAQTSDEEEQLIVFKVVHDFNDPYNVINTQTYNYTASYQVRPKISVMYTVLSAVAPSFVTTTLNNKVAPLGGGTVYMRYNPRANEKFELISSLDLSAGQEVVIRQRYLNTREIVVIEE